jgi:hypothetical protein
MQCGLPDLTAEEAAQARVFRARDVADSTYFVSCRFEGFFAVTPAHSYLPKPRKITQD